MLCKHDHLAHLSVDKFFHYINENIGQLTRMYPLKSLHKLKAMCELYTNLYKSLSRHILKEKLIPYSRKFQRFFFQNLMPFSKISGIYFNIDTISSLKLLIQKVTCSHHVKNFNLRKFPAMR